MNLRLLGYLRSYKAIRALIIYRYLYEIYKNYQETLYQAESFFFDLAAWDNQNTQKVEKGGDTTKQKTATGVENFSPENAPGLEHPESPNCIGFDDVFIYDLRPINLFYLRARYFDPVMGRFLQTDPMGYKDSPNLYQAFNMNPVNFVDPMGKWYIRDNTYDKMHNIANKILYGGPIKSMTVCQGSTPLVSIENIARLFIPKVYKAIWAIIESIEAGEPDPFAKWAVKSGSKSFLTKNIEKYGKKFAVKLAVDAAFNILKNLKSRSYPKRFTINGKKQIINLDHIILRVFDRRYNVSPEAAVNKTKLYNNLIIENDISTNKTNSKWKIDSMEVSWLSLPDENYDLKFDDKSDVLARLLYIDIMVQKRYFKYNKYFKPNKPDGFNPLNEQDRFLLIILERILNDDEKLMIKNSIENEFRAIYDSARSFWYE